MTRKRSAVNHELMHKINRSLILSSLRKTPSQTRAKLANHTGLTRSTISNLTDELIQKDFIHEVGYEESTGGRRGILLELNPEGGSAIALKINASSVQCALANLIGEILWHKLIPITSTEADYVLDVCKQLIQQALNENQSSRPVLGIGVGTTGLISESGDVIYSKFMDWHNLSFRKDWEQLFGLPVSVDNEVSLAAFGENHYGYGTHDSHFMYIEIGYGLGAGIVINGQLYQGRSGFAGEIGYMKFSYCLEDGTLQTNTWQSMINIPSLLEITKRCIEQGESTTLSVDTLSFDTIIAAGHDDAAVNKAFLEMSRYLGMGLGSLINIFDIPVFIIGGELGRQYAPYLTYVHEEIKRHLVHSPSSDVDVRVSNLMPDAALMGAVAQVFDEILKEPSLNVNL